jgi:adenine-specific DNA-methyltransferase
MADETNPIPRVTRNDPAAHSGDVVADNVGALKALFPATLIDGKVDFDVLRQLLGDAVEDGAERYGLSWKGKARARAFALTPSLGTLRPVKADSKDWDATRNIVIEGDNLEALKLLRKSYANNVKLIYIDPPYNTGGDFVYPDNYSDSLYNYEMLTGQRDGDGTRMTTNQDSSGRYHTDWLTMMYPRLLLARDLLRTDGVLAIQFDDNEIGNVVTLLESIFGKDSIMNLITVKMSHLSGMKMSHVDRKFPKIKEYIGIWVKSPGVRISPVYVSCSWDEAFPRYSRWIVDPALPPESWTSISVGEALTKAGIAAEDTERFLVDNAHHVFRTAVNDALSGTPRDGRFRKVITGTGLERVAFQGEEVIFAEKKIRVVDGVRQPTQAIGDIWSDIGINNLHNEGGVSFPNGKKPIKLIQRLVQAFTAKDDLVVDFFAGSGTTGHAVMTQNAADGGKRRYILVQLPEPLNPAKSEQKLAAAFCDELGYPRTIAELTKERLRRAGVKVTDEHPAAGIDTGFRVYKLATSNLKPWQPGEDLAVDLLDATQNVLPGRSEDDLLVELLLKTGIDLALPSQTRTIAGCAVHSLGGGTLIVCLPDVPAAQARALGDGIADWLDEMAPPAPTTFFFKDSGFDAGGNRAAEARANLAATLRQRRGDDAIEKLGAI